MNFKVLLYLCLIEIVRSRHLPSKQDHHVAYSSIYTSFGPHIDIKDHASHDDKHTEESPSLISESEKLPSVDAKTSAPISEDKTTKKPLPEQTSTAKPIPVPTPPSEPAPVHEAVNEESKVKTNQESEDNDHTESPLKPQPEKKVSLSVPLKEPIKGKDRHITPGLSEYASSGEETESKADKITVFKHITTEASDDANSSNTSITAKSSMVSETSEIPKKLETVDSKKDIESHKFESFEW